MTNSKDDVTTFKSYDFNKIDFKTILLPEQSEWTCYLFGNRPGGMGMAYVPQKGQVPNRFVRFMMRICFDCYWVKEDDL